MNRISVVELKEHLGTEHQLQLIDVRETWEYELGHLPDSTLVPLSTIPTFIDEADASLTYVFICHHGIRSARAAGYALAHGFEQVYNLTGGVAAWAAEVDPQFPVY